MGAYVNPPDGDIEGWLNSNGKEISVIVNRDGKEASVIVCTQIPNGWLPVILHDLDIRKIAAIVFDKNELARELRSTAFSVTVYIVPVVKLLQVSPGLGTNLPAEMQSWGQSATGGSTNPPLPKRDRNSGPSIGPGESQGPNSSKTLGL
jgi:hypothetical protein